MRRAWLRDRLWHAVYAVTRRLLGDTHDFVVDVAERATDARLLLWRERPELCPPSFRDALEPEWTDERLERLYAAIEDER